MSSSSRINVKRAFEKIFADDGDTNGIFSGDTPLAKTQVLHPLYNDETPMEPLPEKRPTQGLLSPVVVSHTLVAPNILPSDEDDILWRASAVLSNTELPTDTEMTLDNDVGALDVRKWIENILSYELTQSTNKEITITIKQKQ